MIWITAGPRRMTKREGKKKRINGNNNLTGSFVATSSAR
jgi:hypothetical protein